MEIDWTQSQTPDELANLRQLVTGAATNWSRDATQALTGTPAPGATTTPAATTESASKPGETGTPSVVMNFGNGTPPVLPWNAGINTGYNWNSRPTAAGWVEGGPFPENMVSDDGRAIPRTPSGAGASFAASTITPNPAMSARDAAKAGATGVLPSSPTVPLEGWNRVYEGLPKNMRPGQPDVNWSTLEKDYPNVPAELRSGAGPGWRTPEQAQDFIMGLRSRMQEAGVPMETRPFTSMTSTSTPTVGWRFTGAGMSGLDAWAAQRMGPTGPWTPGSYAPGWEPVHLGNQSNQESRTPLKGVNDTMAENFDKLAKTAEEYAASGDKNMAEFLKGLRETYQEQMRATTANKTAETAYGRSVNAEWLRGQAGIKKAETYNYAKNNPNALVAKLHKDIMSDITLSDQQKKEYMDDITATVHGQKYDENGTTKPQFIPQKPTDGQRMRIMYQWAPRSYVWSEKQGQWVREH